MKLKLLIVDDEPPARDRIRTMLSDEKDVEIVGESADGESAIKAIQQLKPDVVFLDIRMPGMDGFEMLETIEPAKRPWVVFLTAYDQHAVRAFEQKALDYLLKPASRARIKSAVQRVRERLLAGEPVPALQEWLAERENSRRLVVRNGSRVIFVPVANILWIEAADNYALIHEGKNTHILRETLNNLEKRLPQESFLRVSRGAIINLKFVTQLEQQSEGECVAVLANNQRTSITRSRQVIKQRLKL